MNRIEELTSEYEQLGISQQLNYDKLYLYSIITHSTAIEGSTISDLENQMLFDDGISPDKSIQEQLMNLDLKQAYERAFAAADNHEAITTELLCELSGHVLHNTGSLYDTISGRFDSSKGELRLINVSAGRGGKSYLAWQKIPARLSEFCDWVNEGRRFLIERESDDAAGKKINSGLSVEEIYRFSYEAHYRLVNIHPWADGNGRMSRLVMNMLQREAGVIPSIVKTEKRAEYIMSIATAQASEDITPFIGFMMKHHEDNIQEQIYEYKECIQDDVMMRGADRCSYSYKSDTEYSDIKVREPGRTNYPRFSSKQQSILNEITGNPDITIEEIVERSGFSRPTVTRAIKYLKELGVIERIGSKKTGRWNVCNTESRPY